MKQLDQQNVEALSLDAVATGPPAEWHDSYRVVLDESKDIDEKPNLHENDGEKREGWWSWGWGSLPVVKTSKVQDPDGTAGSDGSSHPRRNPSIYFDALDINLNAFSDVDSGEAIGLELDASRPPIVLSSCATAICEAESEEEARQIFSQNIISLAQFQQDPVHILQDSNVLALVDGKMYPMSIASVYFVSLVVFNQRFSTEYLDQLAQGLNRGRGLQCRALSRLRIRRHAWRIG